MSTAQEIVNKAAKKAGVLARNGQVLETGISADILDLLNLMLRRWQNNGVDLGLPTLLAATVVIIDDADEEAIVLQLALRVMVEFKRPINPGVSAAGSDAFTELQAKYETINEMVLDRALTRKRASTFNLVN